MGVFGSFDVGSNPPGATRQSGVPRPRLSASGRRGLRWSRAAPRPRGKPWVAVPDRGFGSSRKPCGLPVGGGSGGHGGASSDGRPMKGSRCAVTRDIDPSHEERETGVVVLSKWGQDGETSGSGGWTGGGGAAVYGR